MNSQTINTNFLSEWQPFNEVHNKVKKAILKHLKKAGYLFQPTNDDSIKKPFAPYSFNEIDNLLGFAYTSTGDYAGLWCCNAGYLWANDTHNFIGFSVNELGEVVGIADNDKEQSIYIKL